MSIQKIHPTWLKWLDSEIHAPYFTGLTKKIQDASQNAEIYPPDSLRYTALQANPKDIRVVILGQDPYHGPGQAHGLSFSVLPGVKIPASLRNIYKELQAEGFQEASVRQGCLESWSNQGVLLLNNVLTVEKGNPNSHKGWGWEQFTDAVIRELSNKNENLVFLLWGKDASEKASHVNLQSTWF